MKRISAEKFRTLIENPPRHLHDIDDDCFVFRGYKITSPFNTWYNLQIPFPIRIEGCEFLNNCILENLEIRVDVQFKNCVFHEDITIAKCKMADLELYGCEIKGRNNKIWISASQFERFTAVMCFANFKLQYIESKDMIISHNIGWIHLKLDSGKSLRIELRRCLLYELKLSGTSARDEVLINDATIQHLTISQFHNTASSIVFNGGLAVEDKHSTFTIMNSNIGKTQFYQLNLISFSSVALIDSYLIDGYFVDIIWKEEFITHQEENLLLNNDMITAINGLDKEDDVESEKKAIEALMTSEEERVEFADDILRKQREVYRQLKQIMNKQRDTVQEQRFYALEMNTHLKLLRWKGNVWDKLILLFSKHFSGYGQRFDRPVIGLFFVNLVLLIIFIVCVHYKSILFVSPQKHDWRVFWKGFGELFALMNPARKFDDSITGALIPVDLLGRVFSSAFIFNMIRASRRFIGS